MIIQISQKGHNIKRLRSDAKRLAKAEKIKLHEAQNRVAEQAGEDAWDAMIRDAWELKAVSPGSKDLSGLSWSEVIESSPLEILNTVCLCRRAQPKANFPYYDVIDISEFFDQLADIPEVEWREAMAAPYFSIKRFLGEPDRLVLPGDRNVVYNWITMNSGWRLAECGEEPFGQRKALSDKAIGELWSIKEAKSLSRLAQWLVEVKDWLFNDPGSWEPFYGTDLVSAEMTVWLAEWLVENDLGESDRCYAIECPKQGWPGYSVYYSSPRNQYALVQTDGDLTDWSAVWLDALEWDKVKTAIDDEERSEHTAQDRLAAIRDILIEVLCMSRPGVHVAESEYSAERMFVIS